MKSINSGCYWFFANLNNALKGIHQKRNTELHKKAQVAVMPQLTQVLVQQSALGLDDQIPFFIYSSFSRFCQHEPIFTNLLRDY